MFDNNDNNNSPVFKSGMKENGTVLTEFIADVVSSGSKKAQFLHNTEVVVSWNLTRFSIKRHRREKYRELSHRCSLSQKDTWSPASGFCQASIR